MRIEKIEVTWMEDPTVRQILRLFALRNAPVFFNGGAVRDTIAGLKLRDIDIITSLPLSETRQMLLNAGAKPLPTDDSNFVLVELEGHVFDVRYSHTPHAVTIDDAHHIVSKFDFSINALFMSSLGEVYDSFNGINDLKEGRINFLIDPRQAIAQHAIVIARYFRFFAKYGKGEHSPHVLEILGQSAHFLKNESQRRIGQQMFWLFNADDPYPLFKIMHELGILDYLFDFPIKDYGKIITAEKIEKQGANPLKWNFDLRLASFLLATDIPPFEALAQISGAWELAEVTKLNLNSALSVLLKN